MHPLMDHIKSIVERKSPHYTAPNYMPTIGSLRTLPVTVEMLYKPVITFTVTMKTERLSSREGDDTFSAVVHVLIDGPRTDRHEVWQIDSEERLQLTLDYREGEWIVGGALAEFTSVEDGKLWLEDWDKPFRWDGSENKIIIPWE